MMLSPIYRVKLFILRQVYYKVIVLKTADIIPTIRVIQVIPGAHPQDKDLGPWPLPDSLGEEHS